MKEFCCILRCHWSDNIHAAIYQREISAAAHLGIRVLISVKSDKTVLG